MTSKDAPAPPPIPAKASRLPPGPPSIASPGTSGDDLVMLHFQPFLLHTESSLKVTGIRNLLFTRPRRCHRAGREPPHQKQVAKSVSPCRFTTAPPIRATPKAITGFLTLPGIQSPLAKQPPFSFEIHLDHRWLDGFLRVLRPLLLAIVQKRHGDFHMFRARVMHRTSAPVPPGSSGRRWQRNPFDAQPVAPLPVRLARSARAAYDSQNKFSFSAYP